MRRRTKWPALLISVAAVGLMLLASGLDAQCVNGTCPTPAWRPAPVEARPETPPPAVCRVIVRGSSGTSYGTGSLVAVRGDTGYVVTCHHVVEASRQAWVAFPGDSQRSATVFARDQQHDLVLLEVAGVNVRPLVVASTATTGAVTAGGYGGSGRYATITGPPVGFAKPLGAEWASVQIRGAVRGGDSGGPVLSRRGELVGVVWGVRDGLTYATVGRPIARLLARIPSDRIASHNPPKHDSQQAGVEVRLRELSAAIDVKLSQLMPCQCEGHTEFARRDELEAVAAQCQQDAQEFLSRLPNGSQQRPASRLLQLLAGALGVGTPVGMAAFALGWLLRRRGHRQGDSGPGGPQSEPFLEEERRQESK